MKNDFFSQISQILKGLAFSSPNRIAVKEKVYEFVHDPPSNQSNLVESLTHIIYNHFYVEGTQALFSNGKSSEEAETELVGASQSSNNFFFELMRANATEEGLDGGWQLETNAGNGAIYAVRGNIRKLVMAGDYVKEMASNTQGSQGDMIKVFKRKEFKNSNDVFYYAYGSTIAEENMPGICRIYFNLKPEGSSQFVNLLTSLLNKYQVPFHFKCPNDPVYYNRADPAVLYLSKCYFNYVLELLKGIYPSFHALLRVGVPLFTYEICEGIAFAESPFGNTESFGMSRSRIISEGMMKALDKNIAPDKWEDEILTGIRQYLLDPEKLHLNPETSYPYIIPKFNK